MKINQKTEAEIKRDIFLKMGNFIDYQELELDSGGGVYEEAGWFWWGKGSGGDLPKFEHEDDAIQDCLSKTNLRDVIWKSGIYLTQAEQNWIFSH